MFAVQELTSARYSATITDEVGAIVAGSILTTLTLTLYDRATGAILNGRDKQNVLNANGVTVDESGLLVWLLSPADNAIVTDSHPQEVHRAVFVATWGSNRQMWHRVDLTVDNEQVVP